MTALPASVPTDLFFNGRWQPGSAGRLLCRQRPGDGYRTRPFFDAADVEVAVTGAFKRTADPFVG